MRKAWVLLTILIFPLCVFGQTKYKTYENPRFGYSIRYPYELLKIQPPSFNGDGRIFISKDQAAEMRVWGEYNALFRTVGEKFDEAVKDYGAGVTYKTLLKNGFVISGIKDDRIYYQKTLYHKFRNVDVFYTFLIEYKKTERKKFDSIVEKIAGSFRFNPKADV